jgi:hypothetical protein
VNRWPTGLLPSRRVAVFLVFSLFKDIRMKKASRTSEIFPKRFEKPRTVLFSICRASSKYPQFFQRKKRGAPTGVFALLLAHI